jgi:hypothetical protein
LNAKGYSAREEQRLLDALGRGLLKEFPNPERSGCPGADVLKRIASRTMPLNEAEKWLDHLGSCSPCYGDFSEFRRVYESHRKRTFLAIAASIVIFVGIAGWVLLQRHNESLEAQTAVLDLRNRSLPRGAQPNPDEPPLVVSHGATHWNIYLPLGSSEGPYDVRVLKLSGESVFSTSSVAVFSAGIASIQAQVNLSSVSRSEYVLQIRRAGSEWSSYSLLVR